MPHRFVRLSAADKKARQRGLPLALAIVVVANVTCCIGSMRDRDVAPPASLAVISHPARVANGGLAAHAFYRATGRNREIEAFAEVLTAPYAPERTHPLQFVVDGAPARAVPFGLGYVVYLGSARAPNFPVWTLHSSEPTTRPVFANQFSPTEYLATNPSMREARREARLGYRVIDAARSVEISLLSQINGAVGQAQLRLITPDGSTVTQPMVRDGNRFFIRLDDLVSNWKYEFGIRYKNDSPSLKRWSRHREEYQSKFYFRLGDDPMSPDEAIVASVNKEQLTNPETLSAGEAEQLSKFKREGNSVFLTLTTSPRRLPFVAEILRVVDLSYVDRVFLALPDAYGRDHSAYDTAVVSRVIQQLEARHGAKFTAYRFGADLGPISKVLPTAKHLLLDTQISRDSVVISIDDDISYPTQMIHHLAFIESLPENRRAVVSGSGFDTIKWGMSPLGWPLHSGECLADDVALAPCDVIEGWAGVAYRLFDFVDSEPFERLNALSPYCRLSDDWVISYVLARGHISRYRTTEASAARRSINRITELSFGFDEDGLHSGGGRPQHVAAADDPIEESRQGMLPEFSNYQRCSDAITTDAYAQAFDMLR